MLQSAIEHSISVYNPNILLYEPEKLKLCNFIITNNLQLSYHFNFQLLQYMAQRISMVIENALRKPWLKLLDEIIVKDIRKIGKSRAKLYYYITTVSEGKLRKESEKKVQGEW